MLVPQAFCARRSAPLPSLPPPDARAGSRIPHAGPAAGLPITANELQMAILSWVSNFPWGRLVDDANVHAVLA